MAASAGSNPARSLMRKNLFKLMAGLTVLALLAGCASPIGGSAKNPADAQSVEEAPTEDIRTFYIDTERGPYFCIYMEEGSGAAGYGGLSCHSVNSTEVGA